MFSKLHLGGLGPARDKQFGMSNLPLKISPFFFKIFLCMSATTLKCSVCKIIHMISTNDSDSSTFQRKINLKSVKYLMCCLLPIGQRNYARLYMFLGVSTSFEYRTWHVCTESSYLSILPLV